MSADLHREPHNDPACTDHPHCFACGAVMVCEVPDTLVCPDCGTDVLCEGAVPAGLERVAS